MYNLDVMMQIEYNFFDNIFSSVVNNFGITKDNEKTIDFTSPKRKCELYFNDNKQMI